MSNPKDVEAFMESHGFEWHSAYGHWIKYLNPHPNPPSIYTPKEATYWYEQTQVAVREAYDLLYWKYKELNDQTVDMKFAEAYGILVAELQATNTKQEDKEVALLRSDIAQAIGYCQGLGYPNSYLEKRYPDIAMTSQTDTKQTDEETS